MSARVIAVFTGPQRSDTCTLDEAEELYLRVAEMEVEMDVTISHETHRSRYFGNPWNTVRLLDRVPGVKLTRDFSHWVCVAEGLLRDADELLARAARNCHHLHARVGYEQGPQASDPRAPEWTTSARARALVESIWHTRSLSFFNLKVYQKYFSRIVLHCFGRIAAEERTFIPEIEFPKLRFRARIYAGLYVAIIMLSFYLHSILPLMLAGLTNLFGTWLLIVYGMSQHAGLAENVLDHRLNCRTVYMNPINRFLYWNMNYHVEHIAVRGWPR